MPMLSGDGMEPASKFKYGAPIVWRHSQHDPLAMDGVQQQRSKDPLIICAMSASCTYLDSETHRCRSSGGERERFRSRTVH
jgi:hypothetical protein